MRRRKRIHIDPDGLQKPLGAEIYHESPGIICLIANDVHQSVVGKGGSVLKAVEN